MHDQNETPRTVAWIVFVIVTVVALLVLSYTTGCATNVISVREEVVTTVVRPTSHRAQVRTAKAMAEIQEATKDWVWSPTPRN